MKSMSKLQLAQCAGVSVRTLMRWCRPYEEELQLLGLTDNMKVLPPHLVKWFADHFDITID